MCDPDPNSTAFSHTTRLSSIMSPSAGPWKSGGVSGSICSQFFDSYDVSDLCPRSDLGSKILHNVAHCQFCIHLPAMECQKLFLGPFPVTTLSHLKPVICALDACFAARSYTETSHVSSGSICWQIYLRGVSGSTDHHCLESSNTSNLFPGCRFGSDLLQAVIQCQLCGHLTSVIFAPDPV